MLCVVIVPCMQEEMLPLLIRHTNDKRIRGADDPSRPPQTPPFLLEFIPMKNLKIRCTTTINKKTSVSDLNIRSAGGAGGYLKVRFCYILGLNWATGKAGNGKRDGNGNGERETRNLCLARPHAFLMGTARLKLVRCTTSWGRAWAPE